MRLSPQPPTPHAALFNAKMIAVRRKFTTFQLFVKAAKGWWWEVERKCGQPSFNPWTKQPSTNYNVDVDVVDFYVPQIEMEQDANAGNSLWKTLLKHIDFKDENVLRWRTP